MHEIRLPGTGSTPEVSTDCENGKLTLRGDSYPENSFEFFQPIIDWVEQFLAEQHKPLSVDLFLLYLNTSSIRALMDILDLLEEAHQADKPVKLTWHYDRENERMAELAEEFKEDCTFPFHIVTSVQS